MPTCRAGMPSSPHSRAHASLGRILPDQAWDMVQKGDTAFIDIRSEAEHFFVGSPPNIANIPWQDAPDWEINPDFVADVSRVARKDRPVILICRSGHRSIDAGNRLIEEGFLEVYSVEEGFEGDRDEAFHRSSVNGWRFRGLPWVQC